MKRSELILMSLQVPLDFILLVAGGFYAYYIRFSDVVTSIRQPQFTLDTSVYLPVVALVAFGWLIIFSLAGLYTPDPNRKFADDLSRIILACSTGFAAITVYIFVSGDLFQSRFIVLAAWILGTALVIAGRLFMRGIRALLYRANIATRHVVIIGAEGPNMVIQNALKGNKGLGYFVRAAYPRFSPNTQQEIQKIHEKKRIDEIIFTNPKAREEEALEIIAFCAEYHITFKYSADLFSTYVTNMAVSSIAGIPIIEMKKTRLDGWGHIVKRLFDITAAAILLVLTSPLLVVAMLLILLTTGRPVIFKNTRVGREGKLFNTFKLRTMQQRYSIGPQFKNTPQALQYEQELINKKSTKKGPLYKIKNDPRVTRLGKYLRRSSIDELPQLWNVLCGSMSLVGPRPHQPREVAHYERLHKVVHAIRPGITGLAQISGRSDLSFEEEIRLDTFYMEHWSFLMDLFIVLKTPFILLRRRKAL